MKKEKSGRKQEGVALPSVCVVRLVTAPYRRYLLLRLAEDQPQRLDGTVLYQHPQTHNNIAALMTSLVEQERSKAAVEGHSDRDSCCYNSFPPTFALWGGN